MKLLIIAVSQKVELDQWNLGCTLQLPVIFICKLGASLVAQMIKNLRAMQET